jgi:hypothetical protein
MVANKTQVGGTHYKTRIEHWDYVEANNLDYFQGQITKYVARWKDKGGLNDLRKAQHFLEKYIELQLQKDPSQLTLGTEGEIISSDKVSQFGADVRVPVGGVGGIQAGVPKEDGVTGVMVENNVDPGGEPLGPADHLNDLPQTKSD